jgi:hypothetical protein
MKHDLYARTPRLRRCKHRKPDLFRRQDAMKCVLRIRNTRLPQSKRRQHALLRQSKNRHQPLPDKSRLMTTAEKINETRTIRKSVPS